jgi:hypothetical protein
MVWIVHQDAVPGYREWVVVGQVLPGERQAIVAHQGTGGTAGEWVEGISERRQARWVQRFAHVPATKCDAHTPHQEILDSSGEIYVVVSDGRIADFLTYYIPIALIHRVEFEHQLVNRSLILLQYSIDGLDLGREALLGLTERLSFSAVDQTRHSESVRGFIFLREGAL